MSSKQLRIEQEKEELKRDNTVKRVKQNNEEFRAMLVLAEAWIDYASSPASGIGYIPSKQNALALVELIQEFGRPVNFDQLTSLWLNLKASGNVTSLPDNLVEEVEVQEVQEPPQVQTLELVLSQWELDKMSSTEYRARLRDPIFKAAVEKLLGGENA